VTKKNEVAADKEASKNVFNQESKGSANDAGGPYSQKYQPSHENEGDAGVIDYSD